MWLEPGIFASVLSPKECFCEGCRLSCPISFLIFSAWAVKSHSVPSLSPLIESKSSLFPCCSLAKKLMSSQASLSGFSSLLPIYFSFQSLSSHCSSSLALPWLPGTDFWPHGNALWLHPGCLAEALPSRRCLNSGPRCLFPSEVTTHLSASSLIRFVPSSSSLCVVWSNESCQPSVSSFFLLFQCSIFIFSK